MNVLALVRSLAAVAMLVLPAGFDLDAPGFFTIARAVAAHAPPQGFGANTPGGAGHPQYHVTSLEDSGPGTLRDAVSRGGRHIVFDVAGDIELRSQLVVNGAFITIDGTTARPPGITLKNWGMGIRGRHGAHDVIVRGIRIRGGATREVNVKTDNDCVVISHGAYNVLIDHVSISGCTDGAIDINGDPRAPGAAPTRDVTVQWSILADTRKMMLVKYGQTRISLHHNLLVRGLIRLPQITRENLPVDDDVTVDMRNNVVWDWAGGSGTTITSGAKANVVNNVYGNPAGGTRDQRQALLVCRGDGVETPESLADCRNGIPEARAFAYAGGNLSLDGANIDGSGNVGAPFTAASVTTGSACHASHEVVAQAGAVPRDESDTAYVALVVLPKCATPPPPPPPPSVIPTSSPDLTPTPPPSVTPPPAPTVNLPDLGITSYSMTSSVARGVRFPIWFTIANLGTRPARSSQIRIYLSRDTRYSSDDIVMRARDIPGHAPGATSEHGITEDVPRTVRAGSYYILFMVDRYDWVKESNEANNVLAVPMAVR